MITLQSYLSGSWQTGTGTPAQLFNPTTEEAIAECSSEGLDMAAAVTYGREVGGAALRAMTFSERGQLLKALAAAIHEYREELIALAIQNGS